MCHHLPNLHRKTQQSMSEANFYFHNCNWKYILLMSICIDMLPIFLQEMLPDH
jgi:hypothetical protein